MSTGQDRSLVPWFGFFTGAGLATGAVGLWRTVRRRRWLAAVGGVLGAVGLASSLVAVGYLVTGTIPESDGAPPTVGASYAVLSAGVFLSLLFVGLVIAINRSLAGRWRWLPLGVLVGQFPIFVASDVVGELSGSEKVTDGLGLALTGFAWTLLGFAMTQIGSDSAAPR